MLPGSAVVPLRLLLGSRCCRRLLRCIWALLHLPLAAAATASARSPVADLEFSAPIVVARGCYQPPKAPGGRPRSSCSSDAVFGLNRMGLELIAGPNGTLVRSRDGGQSWHPIAESAHTSRLEGHAYYWNAAPDTLWEQYVQGSSTIVTPRRQFNSSSHPSIVLDAGGAIHTANVHAETSFHGLPRPVCWFYEYSSTNFVRLPGAPRVWATVKAVVFADEDRDPSGRHYCPPTSRGGKVMGASLGAPGGANMSTVLFNSTDGHTWNFMSVIMDAVDYPDSEEGPNESALAVLGSKLIVVTRIDGGDGSCGAYSKWCAEHLAPMKPYLMSMSADGGWQWARGRAMFDTDGQAIGSARPKLLTLSPPDHSNDTSPLILVGGRPGLYLWLSVNAGRTWKPFNLAKIHNELQPQPGLRFCPATVDARCVQRIVIKSPWSQFTGECQRF
jgi:hypothetical protein